MAHFAKLDDNNVVTEVTVIANSDTSTPDGTEKESIGAAFCERLFGGRWVQTSYNNNFRGRYAGVGYTYNEELDMFITPKPFPSWILNSETGLWEAPVAKPADDGQKNDQEMTIIYLWNEENQQWDDVTPEPPQ